MNLILNRSFPCRKVNDFFFSVEDQIKLREFDQRKMTAYTGNESGQTVILGIPNKVMCDIIYSPRK